MWLMPMGHWGAAEFALGFGVRATMVVGMMLPSTTPMLLALVGHRLSGMGRRLRDDTQSAVVRLTRIVEVSVTRCGTGSCTH
jgi:predicted metal-binding membrane protein